jgi:hypothetical protein
MISRHVEVFAMPKREQEISHDQAAAGGPGLKERKDHRMVGGGAHEKDSELLTRARRKDGTVSEHERSQGAQAGEGS